MSGNHHVPSFLAGLAVASACVLYWGKQHSDRDLAAIDGPRLINPNPTNLESSKFAQLSHGRVHYRFSEPLSGPKEPNRLIVLVHGFIGSTEYFSYLADHLANVHQLRVLRFDLYGRGFTDCPNEPNSARLFASQLAELLFKLDITYPVDLVGYSMGGGISLQFASCYPEKIRTLTLLAAAGAGVRPVPATWLLPYLLSFEFLRNNLGKLILRHVISLLAKDQMVGFKNPTSARAKEMCKLLLRRFTTEPAISRSIGSSLAYFPWSAMREQARAIHEAKLKVMIVWGDSDITVPFEYAAVMVNMLGGEGENLRLFKLPNHGHDFPIEFGECTGDMIASFVVANGNLDSVVVPKEFM